MSNILSNIEVDINEAVSSIINLYHTAAACCKMVATHSIPVNKTQPDWWDNECKESKQHKYSILRRFRITNNNHDFDMYKTARKSFKKICQDKKIKFQSTNRFNLVNSRNNPRQFWSMIKNSSKQSIVSVNINASTWLNYFEQLLYKENQTPLSDLNINMFETDENADNILNCLFTEEEVRKSISKLKFGKSQGKDYVLSPVYDTKIYY